ATEAMKALKRWATVENVPTLVKLVAGLDEEQARAASHWVREPAMEILSQLKDPRGAEALASRLTDFRDRRAALSAPQAFGPGAAKAVVKYLIFPGQYGRPEALKLLGEYKTNPEVMVAQCVADLEADPAGRGRHAAEWLAGTPPIDAWRKPVVAALTPLLKQA